MLYYPITNIAILYDDGKVESIVFKDNKYVEVGGKMLLENYQDPSKIKSLIKLGDIDILGKKLEPCEGEKHTFSHPALDTTTVFRRDRGDCYSEAELFENMNDFISYLNMYFFECLYLYDESGKQWLCTYDGSNDLSASNLKNLEDAMENTNLEHNYELKL